MSSILSKVRFLIQEIPLNFQNAISLETHLYSRNNEGPRVTNNTRAPQIRREFGKEIFYFFK